MNDVDTCMLERAVHRLAKAIEELAEDVHAIAANLEDITVNGIRTRGTPLRVVKAKVKSV